MKRVHNRSYVKLILVTAIVWLLSACDSSEAFNTRTYAGGDNDGSGKGMMVTLSSIDISVTDGATGYKDANGVDIVALNKPFQLQAIGTYSDGSTKELTQTGHWVVTDPTIADIKVSGEGIGLTSGVLSITQEYEGVTSNSLSLKVSEPKMVFWGNSSRGGSYDGEITDIKEVYSNQDAFFIVKNDGTGQVVTSTTSAMFTEFEKVKEQVTDIKSVAVNNYGFAVLKNDGSVVSWGIDQLENDSSINFSGLNDVVKIFPQPDGNFNVYKSTFSAIRTDGSVFSWGAFSDTTDVDHLLTDVKTIFSNLTASAAVKKDGSVVVWGSPNTGGDQDALPLELNNVETISMALSSFAAKKQDGSVVVWGKDSSGETYITGVEDQLFDIQDIYSTARCYAGLKSDGSVVVWGFSFWPTGTACDSKAKQIAQTATNTQKIVPISYINNGGSMAALQKDGTVITWGDSAQGGDSDHVADQLVNVVDIVPSNGGYAALKSDGTVVQWSRSSNTSAFEGVRDQLVNIKSVHTTNGAYAALKEDGTVVTWGASSIGGNSDAVKDQLINVGAIYSTGGAFAAVVYN